MNKNDSFAGSLLEAAKGMALFSALMSLIFVPVVALGILSYIASEALNEPKLFAAGLIFGFFLSFTSLRRIGKLMKEYNVSLWK